MITSQDLFLICFLAFLEGILSIDNALVLALTVKHLPKIQQRKALTYGLAGAVAFRLLSLAAISHLMRWNWVKFVGGGYLIAVSLYHLFHAATGKTPSKHKKRGFWTTVVMIELMDIAFAVDSILAAVALTQKFWIVFVGGMMGVILMRFAATIFLSILHRFPNFETTAYLLILIIGGKLVLEGLRLPWLEFHDSGHAAFWYFWGLMFAAVIYGFRPKSRLRSAKEK